MMIRIFEYKMKVVFLMLLLIVIGCAENNSTKSESVQNVGSSGKLNVDSILRNTSQEDFVFLNYPFCFIDSTLFDSITNINIKNRKIILNELNEPEYAICKLNGDCIPYNIRYKNHFDKYISVILDNYEENLEFDNEKSKEDILRLKRDIIDLYYSKYGEELKVLTTDYSIDKKNNYNAIPEITDGNLYMLNFKEFSEQLIFEKANRIAILTFDFWKRVSWRGVENIETKNLEKRDVKEIYQLYSQIEYMNKKTFVYLDSIANDLIEKNKKKLIKNTKDTQKEI